MAGCLQPTTYFLDTIQLFLDINQPSLLTFLILFLCLFCLYGPFSYILFHKFSRQLSAFSLCSSGLISAVLVLSTIYLFVKVSLSPPQWGAADAEIKVPSDENTELKRSPFIASSRSVYSHTCYAYCQGFISSLLISTLPVHSPAFFPKPLPICSCVGFG